MVQSNNATYGGTGQIEQQFAITRARAMESRRGNRRGHHEQRLWFHHARWSGRNAHRGVHSTEHGRRDAIAECLTPAVRVAPWLGGLGAVGHAGLPRCRTRVARAVLRRSEQTRVCERRRSRRTQSAIRAERAKPAKQSNTRKTPVEPTDAADDEPGQEAGEAPTSPPWDRLW